MKEMCCRKCREWRVSSEVLVDCYKIDVTGKCIAGSERYPIPDKLSVWHLAKRGEPTRLLKFLFFLSFSCCNDD